MHSPRHKVIITGTGRSGTTLLVRLLTELGLDTGYRSDTWQEHYFAHCQAGLERELDDPGAPYIVKNPELCVTLGQILARTPLVIDHAIIPIRALEEAALSRVRVGGDGRTPGGLVAASDAATQQATLADRFHRLVETLTAHDIPHTFLLFPRFARDEAYAFAKLRPVLGDIAREQFGVVFRRIARPELIHTFDGNRTVDAGQPARAFARLRWHKRFRRAIGRIVAGAALIAVGWLLARNRPTGTPPSRAVVTAKAVSPAMRAAHARLMSLKEYLTYLRTTGAFSGAGSPMIYQPRAVISPVITIKPGFEPLLEAEIDEMETLFPTTVGTEPGFFVR